MSAEDQKLASKRAIHQAVRNILFNELGLNKDGIEKLVASTVCGVADKRFSDGDRINAMITTIIGRRVYGQYRSDQLEQLIKRRLDESIARFIDERVAQYFDGKLKIEISA